MEKPRKTTHLLINTSELFVVGGTLPINAPYVVRPADEQLIRAILSGEYCNVLTPRQMGKSSLMVRTSDRLRKEGVRTANIDLTQTGTELNANEWYFGVVSHLKQQLGLTADEHTWWESHTQKSVVQRFSDFLRDVILEEIAEPVVIFIDEIDSTLSLPFTDDFFAAIRATYNARASDPVYKRLTFVLLGVARPGELIKDRSRTPYNIGLSIDLRDFTSEEARELLPGLEAVSRDQAEAILKHVLYWTGGHPYLTQKVCAAIAAINNDQWSNEKTDTLVKRLFLSDEARKESNLQYINDRIQESRDREKLLRIYRQVLSGKPVVDEERDPVKSQLKLSGLVKVTPQGTLVVRNRIYEAVFNRQWIKTIMPKLTSTRITVAAILITIIALTISGVLVYRRQNINEIQAQAYTEGFLNTQSTAVRITNLAGLFRLGGEFAVSARNLFFSLDTDQQLAMFTDLTALEQVGEDLQTVIQGLYTYLENEDHHNVILQAMAGDLEEIEDAFPDSRILHGEIKTWLKGRVQAEMDNDEQAIASYTRAINYNDRNPAIYLDRALAYSRLEQYDEALADLERVVELDPERQAATTDAVQSNASLRDYLFAHQESFPTLVQTMLR
jgi:tetratricopeptide (TPR) repeat protein